jgi:Membrane proteins related to metalloendopeptidases
VIIDHGNGYRTLYAHLSKIYVSTEEGKNHINQGEPLGQMGSTGRSTGTHLHLRYDKGGSF